MVEVEIRIYPTQTIALQHVLLHQKCLPSLLSSPGTKAGTYFTFTHGSSTYPTVNSKKLKVLVDSVSENVVPFSI